MSEQPQFNKTTKITANDITQPNIVSLVHKTLAGGKYQVTAELGRGGMSVVYAATDTTLGRVVAVKVLLAEYALEAGPEAVVRFQQEARSVAKLSHPHIVSIYEYGVLEDGSPFIVMDYLVGVSLADEMQASGLMAEQRVLEIIKQTAEALRHSHTQGVVHRDIKPSNLLLTKGDDGEDYLRVVDFGIAKMQTADNTGKLTRTGQVFGSPLYMSPEQCEGIVADARSDIYSLGCVAYEMLTGRPPHIGKNVVETMHRKMTTEPAPFAFAETRENKDRKNGASSQEARDSRLKLGLQKIILKMLATNPADRHQNADQLLSEIKQLKASLPTTDLADGTTNGERQSRPAAPVWQPALTIGGAVIIVLLAGLGFYSVWSHSNSVSDIHTGTIKQHEQTQQPVPQGPKHKQTEIPVSIVEGKDGREEPADIKIPKRNILVTHLNYWKNIESTGQRAFQSGELNVAAKYFAAALDQSKQVNDQEKAPTLDISLSDLIDLAQARGDVMADQSLWQSYQAMIQDRYQAIRSIDGPLIRAMDAQQMLVDGGGSTDPKVLDPLLASTLKQARLELDDERLADADRLLRKALPLLKNRNRNDGSQASAFHLLSSIRALEHNWQDALNCAELACVASQGRDKALQLNLAQALYFKGWAQAHSKPVQSPEDSYNRALELNEKTGVAGNLGRLNVWRKLAHYYQTIKRQDLAVECANKGIQLALEGDFGGRGEAHRLANLAYFYSVLGRFRDAIDAAREGLRQEDCALPRQDYKVMEDLNDLGAYYKANNQPVLAASAIARAAAISKRLRDYDKIYTATPLQ